MAAIKHTHIYVYYETRKGVEFYKCDDPHCTHYASRKMIINKASVCSGCRKKEIILDWKMLRRRKPKCLSCANTEEARTFRKTQDIMAQILGGGEIKP